ncbi:MAG: glycosyl transferase group 1 [Armatimonadetes bacterium]|nr:glycosyl transferase group 1 [Armatimonadota bacterium]
MRLGLAMEYSLGHVTHADNLKAVLARDRSVRPSYIDLPYHRTPGWWAGLPGVRSNWSLRASLGAYLGLRRRTASLDGALFHTQVTSLLSANIMRRVPSVISLDATPLQYDALGAHYGHTPSADSRVERLKWRLNRQAFANAAHLVCWSEWAKASLVADYGVVPEKVTVIPPGIDTDRWRFPDRTERRGGGLNILFVGGDFQRKGGDTLLEAFQLLPRSLGAHLHLVTGTQGVAEGVPGVTVHHGITANSEALLRLFAEADLFVFPTRADCLPLAVMEALAAGLPVITTRVGALAEAVVHGETGLVISPDDAPAMAEAIRTLAEDPVRRAQFGAAAREAALERFDARTNYGRLLEILKHTAGSSRPHHSTSSRKARRA